MVQIGWIALHEQYPPTELLEYAVLAEQAGFDSIWTADHFHPFVDSEGQCGFAWVWIASAAERTTKIRIGTAVTCPILRYNPAIVAQAFATMAFMYPNRIFLGLGTGEALNEMPVGCEWPPFKERAERLEEAIKIIKLLWTRKRVTFKGKYYTLRRATLYTKPETPMPMYVSAYGPTVAEMAGKYADGFITSGGFPPEHYQEALFPALNKGARSVGRDPGAIEKVAEIFVSYDENFDRALESARFWAACALPVLWWKYPIYDPREIEACGELVGNEQLAKIWCISTDLDEHVNHIERCIKLGFDHVYIASSSPDERKTLEIYGKKILPYLRETYVS